MKFREFDIITRGCHKGEVSERKLRKNLRKLRKEICLNNMYLSDYNNTFGLDPKHVQSFFDGYVDYLSELEKESGEDTTSDFAEFLDKYDTTRNLVAWYYCHDEFSDDDETYYQPEIYSDNGTDINYSFPQGLYSWQVFRTEAECYEWLEENGYSKEDCIIRTYHNDDIEDRSYVYE